MLAELSRGIPSLSAPRRITLALWIQNRPLPIASINTWLSPKYRVLNVYSVLSKLVRTGFIAPSRGDGTYELAPAGRTDVKTNFPLLPSPVTNACSGGKKSSGQFIGVFLEGIHLNPSKRRKLLRFFSTWKFGRLIRGVYISPHLSCLEQLKQLVIASRLTDSLYHGFLSFDSSNIKSLVEVVWRYSQRAKTWKLLLDHCINYSQNTAKKTLRKTTELKELHQRFLHLLLTDPMLPPSVLPEKYPMTEVAKLIQFL